MSLNIDFATLNITDTPKTIYYLNGKPVYRMYISGTLNSNGNAQNVFSDTSAKIVDFVVMYESTYSHSWKAGQWVKDSKYSCTTYMNTARTILTFEAGEYARGKAYDGYVDYIKA